MEVPMISKKNHNFFIFLHFAYSFEFAYIPTLFFLFNATETKYLHECLYILRIFTYKQDLNTSVEVKISRLNNISNLIVKVFENNQYYVPSTKI